VKRAMNRAKRSSIKTAMGREMTKVRGDIASRFAHSRSGREKRFHIHELSHQKGLRMRFVASLDLCHRSP
jgi:hypothetical protein